MTTKRTKKARIVKLTKKAKAIARRAAHPRKKPPVVVNKVALRPGHVLSATVPVGHAPVVVQDHEERRVEIVPVPLPVVKEKRWWERMFGPQDY